MSFDDINTILTNNWVFQVTDLWHIWHIYNKYGFNIFKYSLSNIVLSPSPLRSWQLNFLVAHRSFYSNKFRFLVVHFIHFFIYLFIYLFVFLFIYLFECFYNLIVPYLFESFYATCFYYFKVHIFPSVFLCISCSSIFPISFTIFSSTSL